MELPSERMFIRAEIPMRYELGKEKEKTEILVIGRIIDSSLQNSAPLRFSFRMMALRWLKGEKARDGAFEICFGAVARFFLFSPRVPVIPGKTLSGSEVSPGGIYIWSFLSLSKTLVIYRRLEI